MSLRVEERKDEIIFRIRVRPSASCNKIKGLREEALKIDINALPIKGKANKECIKFLAEILRVPRPNIEIVSGLKSKNKLIKIKGISKEDLLKILSPK